MLKTGIDLLKNTSRINAQKAITILLLGFVLTFLAAHYTKTELEKEAENNFRLICNDLKSKISIRLNAHALLLRTGSALFSASDSINRNDWHFFYERAKINKNLPGIQGIGIAVIVPKNQLQNHIEKIRKKIYPNYTVRPLGNRDFYSSILFLEPLNDRNLKAIGFDMYSEPIRRKAMEIARDSDLATLSGKVILVQEIDKNIQAGTLMYVPVYDQNLPINTVEQRRKAIRGWVYSPYRMNDLMQGILGRWNLLTKDRVHMHIYDNATLTNESLLFDSQTDTNSTCKSVFTNIVPIEFNGKRWTLVFSQMHEESYYCSSKTVILIIAGTVISILISILTLSFYTTRQRAKQLEELDATKNKIFSIIAHDLRNPFTGILGYSELLLKNLRKYDLNKIEQFIRNINTQSENTFSLLENLLSWAKTQTGQIDFKPKPTKLQLIICESINIANLSAQIKNIELKYELNNELIVNADSNLLHTVFRNLLSNAIKYTHPGGLISITTKSENEVVIISIADNGVGMSEEICSKLFRIDSGTTRMGTAHEKGSGLGLVLCKEFIEMHGGRIWVESELEKGSKFKFTIPNITNH